MKKLKRIICSFLAICLLVTLCSGMAFADVSGPVFNAGNSTYYATLDDALSTAMSGNVIYVEGDTTLMADAIIPAGVKVIIASNASRNDTESGNNAPGGVVNGSAFATLTIPAGVTLTVNGTLLVAGNQQSTQPKSGCLTGNYGAIELSGSIVVANKLYARGLICGSGTVTALNGSSVYQLFQISDWRGGSKSVLAYSQSVFPFNLYEVKNIQANAIYSVGSSLIGQVYIYANSTGFNPEVTILGSSGLLQLNSGFVSTAYSSNVLTATINGNVHTGAVSMTINGVNYSSSSRVLPFGYNMDVVISGTGSLVISNKMKLLPGCDITNTGSLTISSGAALYLYNAADYSPNYNFAGWTSSANATVSSPSTVIATGTFAQSSSSGRINVYEFVQSSYWHTTVKFVKIA